MGARGVQAARRDRLTTLHARLRAALKVCTLSAELTWYQCTRRHTFASPWVMANGSIEKLAAVLGRSSTEVTRRYAHLRPEHFKDADRRLLDADLFHPGADVVPLASEGRRAARGGALGPRMARASESIVAQGGGSA